MKKIAIIGGGIIGLTIALELSKRKDNCEITIYEKEDKLGKKASTLNSGVVHAGFYYEPSTTKAKITAKGNKLMRDFIERNTVKHDRCGKLVVSTNKEEHNQLNTLKHRADLNGAKVEIINYQKAKEINKLVAKGCQYLWSPNTWAADPRSLIEKIEKIMRETNKIRIHCNYPVAGIQDSHIYSNELGISEKYDFIINAAGIQALRIASKTDNIKVSKSIILAPFVGKYLKAEREIKGCDTHIYPVPNPDLPFLGIHLTKTSDNKIKLGPTATPIHLRINKKMPIEHAFANC